MVWRLAILITSVNSSAFRASIPIWKMLWIKRLSISLLAQRMHNSFFKFFIVIPILPDSMETSDIK